MMNNRMFAHLPDRMMGWLGWVLIILAAPLSVQAATYVVGDCSGSTHDNFAAAYNGFTTGGPHTIRLCPGTHTTSAVTANWRHADLTIESLSGNPADTELRATGATLMTTAHQHFTIRNLTFSGNIAVGNSGSPFRFINVSADSDITSGSANLIFEDAQVTGDITSGGGRVELTDSSVTGAIRAQNGVTVNATSVVGNMTATNGPIELTGGAIEGAVGTNGNSQPITLTDVIMPSGSVHTAGATVTIDNSTLGSGSNAVPINANNGITVTDSEIWGDLTAQNWATIALNANTVVYGTCTPPHTGEGYCGAAPELFCSDLIGQATINELRRSGGGQEAFIEIRILDESIPTSVWSNWTLSYCSARTDNCQTNPLDSAVVNDDGYPWLLLTEAGMPDRRDISLGTPGGGIEVRLNDANGHAIDYLTVDNHQAGLAVSCPFQYDTTMTGSNTFGIMRLPDGIGDWMTDGPGNSGGGSTPGAPNDGIFPIEDSIRYFRIEHSGEGLTCRAEPVTVKACANENCSALYSGDVTVRLLPNNTSGTYWMDGPNERSFTGGEATFLLRRIGEGNVTVGLTDSSPAASGVTRCVRAGQEGSCVINFADVGLEIDPIPTQIAGRPSDQGDSSTTQIHVVRTDDATGACIPALSDQTLRAYFSYLNPEASQALADNRILIDADSRSTLTAVNATQPVDLAFDTEGMASFALTSQDAGRHHLQVRLDIPVTDGQGEATAERLTRTRPSNAFVVRPLAVFADASDNPNALAAEDDMFQVAGDDFALNFATVGWTSALDDNDDGQWDACGAATLDDPNTAVRVPAWDLGQPGATLVAPADGEHPGLDFADTNVQIPDGSDQIEVDTRYDEIGIIQLHESVDFLGEAVMVCSPNIGRFIPDHFTIIPDSVTAACTAGNTPFTYYGQDGFTTAFTMQALNAAGEITQNYTADFARFELNDWLNYDFTADDLPSGLALMDGANPPSGDWNQGVANVTATHMVTRQGPVNPATLTVTARPVDTDGVTTPERMAVSPSTELRYGRLEMHNAHGPEILPLTVPLLIRYYHDGAFRRNIADACTEVQLSCLGWEPHGLVDYDHNAAHMDHTSTVQGAIDLTLDAPGAGNTGHVNLDMDLSVHGCDRPWLQYNWTGNSPKYDENPTARATFGIRRNRYVDIRELY